MQVGDPTLIQPTVIPAQIQPVRPPVRPTGDGRAAGRDRGDAPTDGGTSFRAALDATLPEGTGGNLAPTLTPETGFTAQAPRPEKRPSGDLELDGAESAQLYSDTLNATRDDAPAHDGFTDAPVAYAQQRYRAVTRQYVQSFFAVGGTFAARGDSLEITA